MIWWNHGVVIALCGVEWWFGVVWWFGETIVWCCVVVWCGCRNVVTLQSPLQAQGWAGWPHQSCYVTQAAGPHCMTCRDTYTYSILSHHRLRSTPPPTTSSSSTYYQTLSLSLSLSLFSSSFSRVNLKEPQLGHYERTAQGTSPQSFLSVPGTEQEDISLLNLSYHQIYPTEIIILGKLDTIISDLLLLLTFQQPKSIQLSLCWKRPSLCVNLCICRFANFSNELIFQRVIPL